MGGSATFKVRADGSYPLSYRWYFNGASLLAGETNAQLNLVNLQTNQAGLYSVVVSNGFGSVTSAPARLLVFDACVGINLYAGLSVTGLVGRTYAIESAPELSATNWTLVATNRLTQPRWLFIDTFREPHRKTAGMGEGQTPAIADFAGDRCLVVTANCQLKALRVADGAEVWKFDCIRHDARATTIPTPLIVGNLILDMADGDGNHVVEVDRARPGFPTRMLWKKDQGLFTAIHQFRRRDGFLYGFLGHIEGESEKTASDSALNLTCMELATGKIRWSDSGYKTGVAIIEADGLLFVRSYQTLRLIAAEPDACHRLSEVKTHSFWKPTRNLTDFVSPVLAAGCLYIRTPEELICYRVKQ